MMGSARAMRALIALALIIPLLAACSGSADLPAVQVVLPKDDSPHPAFNTEWWYYNGHLRTDADERYDFHYVVFEVRVPGLRPINVYQLAITDEPLGRYITDQRSVAGHRTRPDANGFAYANQDWSISGHNGQDRLAASSQGYAFDLNLRPMGPAAIHGGTGLLDFTPIAKTYYYSRTRMSVSGTLTADGQAARVTGEAWFDHQWGNFQPYPIGWDWFALQLAVGSDVMLFRLKDASGKPFSDFGTVVAKDGGVTSLTGADFQVEATGSWHSPASRGDYPMGWRVRVPRFNLDLTLAPVLPAAEFDATPTTFNYYWEGAVTMTGSHAGQGFVELVGYAKGRLPGSG